MAKTATWLRLTLGLLIATVSSASTAADAAYGEYLSSQCTTCHQLDGTATEGIPSIIGWPEPAFVAAMSRFRHDAGTNPIMRTIARALSEEETEALAAYFGQLKNGASGN